MTNFKKGRFYSQICRCKAGTNTRTICTLIVGALAFSLAFTQCTKMDEDYKTNTNTGQKGIIIVNPDKIVK